MNYNDKKIIGHNPQTGEPVYEDINQQQMMNQTFSGHILNDNQNNLNNQPIQQVTNPQVPSNSSIQQTMMNNKKDQGKLIKLLFITNILTVILLIIFIVAFILKDTNSKEIEEVKEDDSYISTATENPVSKDWTEYQFSINGKTLLLPCSYKEFKDISGFSMKSSDEKSYLQRNYSKEVNLYIGDSEDQKLALYTHIKNNTNEDLQYNNAEIARISQTLYQVEKSGAKIITYPGNLTVGMEISKEKIIELFGEPTEIKEYSDYNYITYNSDTSYTTINYYEIILLNGKIDELTLDHRKY